MAMVSLANGVAPGTVNNGGGMAGMSLQDLINQYGQAQKSANEAGQAQYQNLLNSVAATQSSILGKHGYLTDAGNQATADTKQATANSLGSASQDMMNRGLGNTTIQTSALAGIANKGQQSLNNIQEAVGAQKAGMSLDLGKLNADSILSRQNQGPSDMYLQLIRSLSSQGGRTNSFSNAGSMNAMNAPMGQTQGGGYGQTTPQTEGFVQGNNAGNNPGYSPDVMNALSNYNASPVAGGLSRPGDMYFGGESYQG